MEVYEVIPNMENHEWLSAEGAEGQKWLRYTHFIPLGQRVASNWTPIRFSSTDPNAEGYRGPLPPGDFVGVNPKLALRPSAMSQVGELMSRYGELLPIQHIGHPDQLFWFHCTTLIDAMDEGRSVLQRFPDGRIMSVKRLWVDPEKLRDALLFHIPQNGSCLLCTDAFKQLIETLGLTGVKFTLKWSDEPAGIQQIREWEQRALADMPPFPVTAA